MAATLVIGVSYSVCEKGLSVRNGDRFLNENHFQITQVITGTYMKQQLTLTLASVSLMAFAVFADARSGEEIYKTKCSICHATGVAGAPRFADAAAWEQRIAKGKDALYTSAANGLNGMPAKGMCVDCTDEELKATVDYIVSHAKPKEAPAAKEAPAEKK